MKTWNPLKQFEPQIYAVKTVTETFVKGGVKAVETLIEEEKNKVEKMMKEAMEDRKNERTQNKTETKAGQNNGGISPHRRAEEAIRNTGEKDGIQKSPGVVRGSSGRVCSLKFDQMMKTLDELINDLDDPELVEEFKAIKHCMIEYIDEWQCLDCGSVVKVPHDYDNPQHCENCGKSRCWPRGMAESDRMSVQNNILVQALGGMVKQKRISNVEYKQIMSDCSRWQDFSSNMPS